MNHNTCTCSGCMESRALAAEREVARLTAENARLREALAKIRDTIRPEDWPGSNMRDWIIKRIVNNAFSELGE